MQAVSRTLFDEVPIVICGESWKFGRTAELKSMLYFLPKVDTKEFRYGELFRIAIVSLLDKFNFCTTSIKRSCIHFVTADCQIIPIDAYYLFYSLRQPDNKYSLPVLLEG